jgi:hypothetical protein
LARYLREGFDQDDMYIMVEDEFYAVAQTFTQHLHHAEYVRRRKQAKLENATAINNPARPTDGKTKMSKEMLKRKEYERLANRQREGLDELTPRRPRVGSDDEGENSDLEEDRDDDPWVGTSLHTFMTSPRKNRSLVGLERIRSNTRAAAGLRPRSSGGEAGLLPRTSSKPRREEYVISEADSDEDDDLEITTVNPVRRIHLPRTPGPSTRPPGIKQESPDTVIKAEHDVSPKRNGLVSRQPTTLKNTQSRKRIFFDELDDSLEDTEERKDLVRIQVQPRSSVSATAPRSKDRSGERGASKSRFSDIPTFLG